MDLAVCVGSRRRSRRSAHRRHIGTAGISGTSDTLRTSGTSGTLGMLGTDRIAVTPGTAGTAVVVGFTVVALFANSGFFATPFFISAFYVAGFPVVLFLEVPFLCVSLLSGAFLVVFFRRCHFCAAFFGADLLGPSMVRFFFTFEEDPVASSRQIVPSYLSSAFLSSPDYITIAFAAHVSSSSGLLQSFPCISSCGGLILLVIPSSFLFLSPLSPNIS